MGTGIISFSWIGLILIANITNTIINSPDALTAQDIIDTTLVQSLFNLLTEARYIECESFKDDAVDVMVRELNIISKKLYTWISSQDFAKGLEAPVSAAGVSREQASQGKTLVTLVRNSKKGELSKDIKNKMINFNVPMQCFYYAMTVVKTTYNKETGPLLIKYFENRDEFMEDYKKKEEKKKGK
jgi:hypothetical protein